MKYIVVYQAEFSMPIQTKNIQLSSKQFIMCQQSSNDSIQSKLK